MFDRVHRLGRFSPQKLFPRAIVAKFTYFKDKELVRTRAAQRLIGTRFRVKEQYPTEIEDRRKLLYGEAKTARQNPNNKVKLVRDKLFINGRQFMPSNSNNNQQQTTRLNTGTSYTSRQNVETTRHEQRVRFTGNNTETQIGRNNRRQEQQLPQQSTPQQQRKILTVAKKKTPYTNHEQSELSEPLHEDGMGLSYGANVLTKNRYGWLGEQSVWSDDELVLDTNERQPSWAGKTKPTSPLDANLNSKRQREYTSDTSNHSEHMDYEQLRDNTADTNGTEHVQQYTTHL